MSRVQFKKEKLGERVVRVLVFRAIFKSSDSRKQRQGKRTDIFQVHITMGLVLGGFVALKILLTNLWISRILPSMLHY